MPSNELVCPKHGPYSASYGTCPVCSRGSGGMGNGGRPQAPRPLSDDEDNVSTDLGGRLRSSGGGTTGAGGFTDYADQDDMPTDIPARRSGGRGRILDEDEEETNFNRGKRDDETELDVKPTGAEIILWVKEGNRRGKIYKVKDQDVIGKSNCDVLLDDPKVSKLHAKITCEDGVYYIWDLGSRNGVYVNGDKIRAATALEENFTIKLGDMLFVVKLLN